MTTWNPEENVLISDSEDEDLESRNFKGREAILFVVDAKLHKTPERFSEAMDIIKNAFISGMIVNDKELMGLMFINTEHSPEPLERSCLDDIVVPQNAAVFLPLRQLSKAIVDHYLQFILTESKDFNKYGVAENNVNFAAMIRLCLNLFDNSTFPLREAKIVLLTDNAKPHPYGSHEYQMALQKAIDLEGRLVEFYLIPMIDDFDYEPFYKEFLTLTKAIDIDSFEVPDAQQQREILTERKLKQDFSKRCLVNFNFVIGPKVEISARLYNYYHKRLFPRRVRLLRRDNTLVERKFIMTVSKEDPASQELIEKRDLKMTDGWYEIDLGLMPIRISMERLNRVRNLHTPQMMLLGFRPMSDLPKNFYYKPCNFIYPDDNTIVGSKRLFRALWERCLAREKFAVCMFMARRKSKPRYVALVPIIGKRSEATMASEPCNSSSHHSLPVCDGFKIIYLAFYNHLREIDYKDYNSIDNSASGAGVLVMEKIVKKLKINYQPEMVGDPALEKLQEKLIRMALNIRVEQSDIRQLADPDLQDQRIEHLLPEFKQIFGDDEQIVAKKRKTDAADPDVGDFGGKATKIKKVNAEDLEDIEKVRDLVKNDALKACTKDQLNGILDKHFDLKLAKSTTKTALIERINDLIKI